MYDTSGTHSVCYAPPSDNDINLRIDRLRDEIAFSQGPLAAARARELELTLSMVNPVSTEEAFAWFGTLLGLFPPFAIFARILGERGVGRDGALYWGLLFLIMNALCCVVGRKFAGLLGRKAADPRAWKWPAYVCMSVLMALAWGVVTGGSGGAVGFGIGAFVGVACAVPVALSTFPVFAVLHRVQSHGGMIEERDLWPLAFGIPLTAAALILSAGTR
jgi:hypothetical protein